VVKQYQQMKKMLKAMNGKGGFSIPDEMRRN